MSEERLAGRYRLEKEIARGGMATVWQATDEVLNRTVAAKVLHEKFASDSIFRERFHLEAISAARLSHPNIVAIFDTGEEGGVPFIVMEYLPGGTLRDLLNSGDMDPAKAAGFGVAVCDALQYAHNEGIIHRDVKPANILFSESGLTKVADFGIAKAAFGPSDLTDTGAILGTVRYLSPEQVQGIDPDGRADVYSLGVVLYEAVTGKTPFTGDSDLAMATARVSATPPSPRDVKPAVPKALDQAIMRAMSPQREMRFEDAAAFARALRPIAGDQDAALAVNGSAVVPSPQRTAVPAKTSFLRSEGRWLVPTILIVGMAAALVASVVRFMDRGSPQTEGSIEPVKIVAAGTYDPPPGDGSENDDETGRSIDSDPTTAWKTSSYKNDKLGGLKDGVGIWVDLGEPKKLNQLRVTSVKGGWEGSLRYSDDAETWSPEGVSETISDVHQFDPSTEHRYWMIWITKLTVTPEYGTESRPFTVAISEIEAFAQASG